MHWQQWTVKRARRGRKKMNRDLRNVEDIKASMVEIEDEGD